uniref:FAD-binding domain-containing protein n=3 Tax=Phaeomonas parva TaxID=124430 RepID=A0A6U4D7Q0_9STRA
MAIRAPRMPAQTRFARLQMAATTEEAPPAIVGDKIGEGGRKLKVVIAGGGVGGLTSALHFQKKGFDVKVYEKASEFRRFGGPIQFASNALSTIKAIDERLFSKIMDRFTFTATRACGIKDGLRASGFKMDDPSFPWEEEQRPDWFVKFSIMKDAADLFRLPYTGVIDRPDLQEILLEEIRERDPDAVVTGTHITSYENQPLDGAVDEDGYAVEGAGGVKVTLSNGEVEEADVLVGADGIWSAVRAQMYGEEIKKSTMNKLRRQGCRYSGYTVFAGETVVPVKDFFETGYKVYIGPKRYFVTSDVGGGRLQWYAFFALPPGSKRAPSGWGGARDEGDPEDGLVDYIKSLHDGWSDEIHYVLDNTPDSAVEQRDLYDRAPELLRSWSQGSATIMGDAAHPMMPNLGQGGCQAIEDAFVLGEKLAGVEDSAQVPNVLQDYYRSRILRTSAVQGLSRLASDLIINAFDTPWSPNDSLGNTWRGYSTAIIKPFLQYVIFPAQFLFLYSFFPTGSMGSLPKQLAEAWESKHKEISEEAFAKAAEEGQTVRPSFFSKEESEKVTA